MSAYESQAVRVGHVITEYINIKSCMASSMTSSNLTLSDLERSNSRSLNFEALYLVKEQS